MSAAPNDGWGTPQRTEAEIEDDERYAAQLELAREHANRVRHELARMRAVDEARSILQREKAGDTDFDDLFLDRSQLRDLPVPDPLISKVLPREAYAILRGRDQSFKSFVALDWGACIATGKAWQGHAVEQGRVLYVAGEGAGGISKRLDAWESGWATDVDPRMFVTRKAALDMHNPGPAFDHLLDHIARGRYTLVIVDTLRRISGRADGNSSEMGRVVDNLDQLRQATDRGTMLVIAHSGKDDKDSRGYSGIEDDADVVWSAKRDEMRLTLELRKMKDGADGQVLRLEAQPMMGSLTLGAASDRDPEVSNANQLLILETLRTTFRNGASPTTLIESTGIAKQTLYRALNALEDAGHVVNTGTKRQQYWEIPPLLTLVTDEPEPSLTDTPIEEDQ